MKCPNCHYTMKCISQIHDVPNQPGRQRMDLHCVRPREDFGRGCDKRCFMGVITEDPKEWVCHEYQFTFEYDGVEYYLCGNDTPVDLRLQSGKWGTATYLYRTDYYRPLVETAYFVPISTGDDMHERAWELFYRLLEMSFLEED